MSRSRPTLELSGIQLLQPLLLEGEQRMGNLVFFDHRHASFDCQFLGLPEMLVTIARGQSVRCVVSDCGLHSLRPLEVA